LSKTVGNKVKIILTLDESGNFPVSPNDISWKTGLEKAYVQQLLQQLEEADVVTKVPPLSESMADIRFYKLTTTAKKQLRQMVATQLEELIGRPQTIQIGA
jgi:DNA-binding MarR family transcriptional regulator